MLGKPQGHETGTEIRRQSNVNLKEALSVLATQIGMTNTFVTGKEARSMLTSRSATVDDIFPPDKKPIDLPMVTFRNPYEDQRQLLLLAY